MAKNPRRRKNSMKQKQLRPFIAKTSGKYSVSEIAAYLGVPDSWVYDRTRRNAIPLQRIGKYVRFDLAEIEAWSKAGCPTTW
jgi:excisionase family DNA binding protein